MKVLVPKFSGFCPGVKHAEEKIFCEKEKLKNKILYVYGQLIHNQNYMRYLEKNNIITVEDLSNLKNKSTIAIRTHGIEKNVEELIKKQHEILDLTCFKVKNLQKEIEKHAKKGFFLILTGKKDHPEIKGLISYANDFYIIENEDDLMLFLNHNVYEQMLYKKNKQSILIVSQTTGDLELFHKSVQEIKKHFKDRINIKVINSICSITSFREKEAIKLQSEVAITFVIGDKMSSNANKIYKILKNNSKNTYFIEDIYELLKLNLNLTDYKIAQVVSSSSTPSFLEKEIIDYLNKI